MRRAIRSRRDVPPEFVQVANNAFAWHNIDADLAQLTYDSVRDEDLVGSRTRAEDASIRAITFTSPALTIELAVTAESLIGQIVPIQVATVELQGSVGAQLVVSTDEIGCFTFRPVPRGTFRLRCIAAGGFDVRTGWITL